MAQIFCSPIFDIGTLISLLRIIRQAVSVPDNPQVILIAKLDLIPKLSSLLDIDNESIRKEVAVIFTNLAACETSCVDLIRSVNGHLKLVSLVKSKNYALVEQCLWALGNVSGDSFIQRDALLDTDLPESIASILSTETAPSSLIKVACWTASNLCHGNPPFEQVTLATHRIRFK